MRDLRQGDEGEDVAILQALVSLHGDSPVESHGIYDDRTRLSVMQYQRLAEVPERIPGEVTFETWRRLLNV